VFPPCVGFRVTRHALEENAVSTGVTCNLVSIWPTELREWQKDEFEKETRERKKKEEKL
jgi:hypothetical protein